MYQIWIPDSEQRCIKIRVPLTAFYFTTGSEIRLKPATCCSWLQESSTDSKRSLKTLRYGAFSMVLKAVRYRRTLERMPGCDAEPVAPADRSTAALCLLLAGC